MTQFDNVMSNRDFVVIAAVPIFAEKEFPKSKSLLGRLEFKVQRHRQIN
jgi:hypothetical protein